MIVDLFAGPGGWDTGLRQAGYTGPLVGIEWDLAACRTAAKAGHFRVQADVRAYPTAPFIGRVRGLIGSPPCPPFSQAGTGAGRRIMGILAEAMTRITRGRAAVAWAEREAARVLREHARKDRVLGKLRRAERSAWAVAQARTAVLVVQPARWISALAPAWVTLEQVPAVLPLWQHLGVLSRQRGYRVWGGILNSEEYGVPQTRRRAVFIASLDGPVGPPVPTHQRYVTGQPARPADGDLFGAGVLPWLSMTEALGWGLPDRPAWTVTSGGTDTGGAKVFGNADCRKRLREEAVAQRNGPQGNATVRELSEPAATISGARSGNLEWVYRASNQAHAATRTLDQPAPAVVPGARSNKVEWVPTELAGDPSARGVRVTVEEAGVLQGFPVDYPWTGTLSQRFQQCGNAIPVQLASAILKPLLDRQETV